MKITKNLEGWFGNRRCHGWAVGLATFCDCCCCCDRQFQVIRSVIYSLRLRGWSSHLLDIWHGWSDDYVALGVIQLPLWIDDQQFRFVCNGFDTLNHLLVGLLHHVVSVHFHDPVAQFQSSSFSCRSNVNFTDKLALQTNPQAVRHTHTEMAEVFSSKLIHTIKWWSAKTVVIIYLALFIGQQMESETIALVPLDDVA